MLDYRKDKALKNRAMCIFLASIACIIFSPLVILFLLSLVCNYYFFCKKNCGKTEDCSDHFNQCYKNKALISLSLSLINSALINATWIGAAIFFSVKKLSDEGIVNPMSVSKIALISASVALAVSSIFAVAMGISLYHARKKEHDNESMLFIEDALCDSLFLTPHGALIGATICAVEKLCCKEKVL